MGSIPELGRSPGIESGSPLQYSCLRNTWTEEPGGLQSIGSQEESDVTEYTRTPFSNIQYLGPPGWISVPEAAGTGGTAALVESWVQGRNPVFASHLPPASLGRWALISTGSSPSPLQGLLCWQIGLQSGWLALSPSRSDGLQPSSPAGAGAARNRRGL